MTAPAAHFAMLHVDNVVESKSNPRKHFGNLEELAASIREKGVLSPVKARPVNGHFELVYGARRLRAAKNVGLTEIPALVQEMSDKDVLVEQVIENAQREDVPPLEEAEGYRALIEKHGYTPDDIAAKVGKSKRVIYERIQLCKLGKEGRAALSEERMNASVALLVARIPGELQAQAVKDLASRDDDDMPLSYRRAVEHVQRNFMLQLKDAPFSLTDQALVMKAGACSACPKRTGNQPELFADVKAKDVCTDPKCYRSKEDALWQLKVKEAEKSGQKVLSAAETKKVFPNEYSDAPAYGTPFVALDHEEYVGGKMKKVSTLLGKDAPPPVLARTPSGKIVELTSKELVAKKVKELEPARRTSNSNDSYARQQKEQERKQRIRRAVVNEAIPKIVAAAEKDAGVRLWRFIAERVLKHSFHDGTTSAAKRRGLDEQKSSGRDVLFRAAMKMNETELRGLVVEVLAYDSATGGAYGDSYGATFQDACKVFGVDLKKLDAAAKKEASAKAKAKKPAAAKKASKKGGKK